MPAERVVLARIGHLGLEVAVRAGLVCFAHLLPAAAIRAVAPEFDSCASDGLSGLRPVDRALERSVTGVHHESERSYGHVLGEERQLVCAELFVRRGVEDVVTVLEFVGIRHCESESLHGVVRLERQGRLPLLRRAAPDVVVLDCGGARAVRGHFRAHCRVVHEVRERDRHESEVDLADVMRRDLDHRPRSTPVALDVYRQILLLDLVYQGCAHLAARGLRPLRLVFGGEVMRGDGLVSVI